VLNRLFWIDWVEIRMSGERLDISSVLIFLWLAYWGWTWGVVGLILAYPLLVSLKLTLQHFEQTERLAILMEET
jgi:predicted PurR-regulated permease PerM